MLSNLEQTIRQYLTNVIHMSLATCHGNRPWICEVHFVFDNDLNLYFRSLSSTRHSQEIAQNSSVSGNIVEQHTAGQKPRGISFEGHAEQLDNVDASHPAYIHYCQRFGTDQKILDDANTEAGLKFYKITVEKFYVIDARESDPSQKYELEWKRNYPTP